MDCLAGYAHRSITPEPPVPLTGYGVYLDRTAPRVLDELRVNTVVIERNGARWVLACFDLLGFAPADAGRLRRRLADVAGTETTLTTVACTHTHSGPPTAPLRGMPRVDESYLERVFIAACEAVGEATAGLHPVTVRYGAKPIEPIGFNRVYGDFSHLDPTLSVLVLDPDRSGIRPIVLAGYACHPVTLGVNDAVSADYPGVFVRRLGEDGYDAAFLQGFCGNIDPVVNLCAWGSGDREDVLRYAEHLRYHARCLIEVAPPVEWEGPDLLVRERALRLPFDLRIEPREYEERLRRAYGSFGEKAIERFIEELREERSTSGRPGGSRPALEVPLQVVGLGQVRLVTVAAEVFSEYGLSLRKRCNSVVPVGCANGVTGYLPVSDSYRRPDDYAASLAPFFYGPAPLDPSAPATVSAGIETLLNATGGGET